MDVGILKKLLEYGNKNNCNCNNKIENQKKKVILQVSKWVKIMEVRKWVVYRMYRINE